MGRSSESCTKEEGLAHEEKTQADGWQGFEGCYIIMQMSGMWKCQENAPSLHTLRAQ